MISKEVLAVVEETRKLASIVKIDAVLKHPNADKLSLAIIGGWQCCIKLDEFKAGDLGLYIEIDSLVPISHPSFAFLEARKEDLKTVGEAQYSRIKSMKFRKELSQGLLIQIPSEFKNSKEGTNLTKELGLLKYEKDPDNIKAATVNSKTLFGKIVNFIQGPVKDNLRPWPTFLDKSEQTRIQNLGSRWNHLVMSAGETWERTVKLDGQSVTVYVSPMSLDDTTVKVCSRNFELSLYDDVWSKPYRLRYWVGQLLASNRRMFRKRDWVIPEREDDVSLWDWFKEFRNKNQHNKFISFPKWKTGIYAMDDRIVRTIIRDLGIVVPVGRYASEHDVGVMVQGELVGPGIQSNYEGLDSLKFFVYRVGLKKSGEEIEYLRPKQARKIVQEIGLDYVPVLEEDAILKPTIPEMLRQAEGKKYFTNNGTREGEVWESNQNDFSFKVISNKYLLDEAKKE